MAEHTPGPWRLEGPDNFSYHLTDQNGEHIAHLNKSRYMDNRRDIEAEANARLIAASPDMLEALKLALTLNGNPRRDCQDEAEWKKIMGNINALIARIEEE